ncbi:MAG: HesA/MoeB/ThiF family protein [Christensenellales bacterium]|jgi:molybdopterin/thiamine biosynthesis adenylyltransferase
MIRRYERQIEMPEIGEGGQRKLSRSSAAVIGAGGLGSPAIYYLAAAGVGHIDIIDSDTVDISNLNRQILHFEADIGRYKAVSAAEKLRLFNSETVVTASTLRVGKENAKDILRRADIVLCCADNFETRRTVNASCVKLGIPMVDGGVGSFGGYVLTVIPHETPCRACVFGDGTELPQRGVIGACAGVVGSLMAAQALKILLGLNSSPGLINIDLIAGMFDSLTAEFDAACPVCGNQSFRYEK